MSKRAKQKREQWTTDLQARVEHLAEKESLLKITTQMAELSHDARLEILRAFCYSCGDQNPCGCDRRPPSPPGIAKLYRLHGEIVNKIYNTEPPDYVTHNEELEAVRAKLDAYEMDENWPGLNHQAKLLDDLKALNNELNKTVEFLSDSKEATLENTDSIKESK